MATVPVEVVVSVQDKFSADLKRAGTATNEFARDLRQTQQITSALTQDLVSRFSPALAQTVVQIGAVARETRGLSPAFTAGAVGITAAVAVLTNFVDKAQEAVQMSARLSTAARSADLGAIRGIMRESVQALELQKKQMEDFSQFWTKLGAGSISGALSSLISGFKGWTTDTKELGKNLGAASAELSKLIPLEAERVRLQERLKTLQADQGRRQTEIGIADRDLNVGDFDQTAGRLRNVTTEIHVVQEQLAELDVQIRTMEARARQAPAAEIGAISGGLRQQIESIAAGSLAAFAALDDRLRQARGGIIERNFNLPNLAGFTEPGSMNPNDAPDVGRELTAERLRNMLELTRVQQESITLSRSEQALLALQVIEAERLLQVEQAQGRVLEINLANQAAQMRAANVTQAERERTDPGAGLAAGFRDAQRDLEESGRAMYEFARSTAQNMHGAFSEHFFRALTGDFKNMPNILRGFGQAMARTIADELSRQTMAPIIGLIRSAVGGGLGRGNFDVGSVASQAIGAPGASGISGAISTAGMSAVQVQALANQGYTVTASSAGPVAVPSPSATSGMYARASSSVASLGASVRQFMATPVFTPSSARAYQDLMASATSPEQAAFLEANTPMESGRLQGSGGQGMSFVNSAMAGLLAAGALTSAYEGYTSRTQDPTTSSVVFGTIGATGQGAQIGYQVSGNWVGAVVGAVIGLVVGATSSSKTGANVKVDSRRRKRIGDAAFVYNGVMGQINSATDREEAASRLVPSQEGVQLTVGQLLASIAGRNISGDFAVWSWPPAEIARKVLGYLLGLGVQPREFNNENRGINNTAELVANFGAQERQDGRPRNDPLEGVKLAEDLLRAFWSKRSRVYIQFSEDLDQAGARGSARQVTRTSVLNYERRGEAAGQQISLLAESTGGLDADQGRRLLESLAKLDYDHNLGILRTEKNGGAQVSVGLSTIRWNGQTISPIPTVALPA